MILLPLLVRHVAIPLHVSCFLFKIKIVLRLYDHLLSCSLTLCDIMRGCLTTKIPTELCWLGGRYHKRILKGTCFLRRAGFLPLLLNQLGILGRTSFRDRSAFISLSFVSRRNAIVKVQPGLFCLYAARLSPQRVGSLSLPTRKRPVAPSMP